MKLSKTWQKFKDENSEQKKCHDVYPQLGRHVTSEETCSRITNFKWMFRTQKRDSSVGKHRFQHFL